MLEIKTLITRYELKYTITEQEAAAIRHYIQDFFSLDRHAPPEDGGYTVNNLYLETPDLKFYYDVKFRKLLRCKPRVRYYGQHPEDLAWLELKYKNNNVIWKFRRPIPADEWPGVLEFSGSDGRPLYVNGMIDSFEDFVWLSGALPILHVRYFREPYVSDINDYGRVTFDRRLSYRMAGGSLSLDPEKADFLYYDDPVTASTQGSPVILEIKVETNVPQWAINLISDFNLTQRGFSKYCYVIDNNYELFSSPRRSAFSSVFR